VLRGKYATFASVGDSRAYLIRARRLNQITQDHSLVAEQVAQGTLTKEQARQSPQRNVLTQALGHRERLDTKLPSIFELVLLDDDRLLLCTDGFYDVLSDDDLVAVTTQNPPQAAADRLVELAKERGTSDNVTAVVIGVNREPAPPTITPSAAEAPGVNITIIVSLYVIALAVIVIAVLLLDGF
jgi:protein phosphatase